MAAVSSHLWTTQDLCFFLTHQSQANSKLLSENVLPVLMQCPRSPLLPNPFSSHRHRMNTKNKIK